VRTALTERLGIEAPIIQGSLGPWSSVRLTAAICEAGALGTLGTALKGPDEVRADIRRLRSLTDRPFAVNHTLRPLSEEAWQVTLEERPPVVSLALGDPGRFVEEAHAAGCLFVHQVHTVEQARRAVAAGVDVVVAQGTEAGGYGGSVAALPLVPQVVDVAGETPVAAAGGVADGRGLAAALALGASGVAMGTRFLATEEAEVPDAWKRSIAAAVSEDAVKATFAPRILPPPSAGGYDSVVPRVLRTAFVDRWNRAADAPGDEEARELVDAIRSGRGHEYLPFTGQTAGLIDSVLPVAEVVRRVVDGADAALRAAARRM
jgi:nitronate monooxygenase/enoyl-[acyl-carrier protein] reductase II